MQQLNLDGKTKTEQAIEFIQKHEPPEGYFLGFSGGKDSVVLYDLAVKSRVKFFPYYSATGIDPPEVCKFIREFYPNVIWKRPPHSFFGEIVRRGFPTKFNRWCCDYLKKNPTNDVPLKHRLMGIRAEESSNRAKRTIIDTYRKWTIYKPIFRWMEWEIWHYIESENLEYCHLYDEGHSRLGCVVCPFLCGPNHRRLNMSKKQWPKHYIAFEKSMKRLYETGKTKSIQEMREKVTFDEFLDNWYRGK